MATLKEVAAHAEVSVQTVSNALNAPHRLKPDTLRRVNRSIALLNYRPNRNARSLRTAAVELIGYCVPSPPNGHAHRSASVSTRAAGWTVFRPTTTCSRGASSTGSYCHRPRRTIPGTAG